MLERFPIDANAFDGPVLVTGAGGCIGTWALALLARAGVPAVAFDLSDDQRRPRPDPVGGAKANVVGTVNVFEAARHHGIRRVAYASSIAALSFLPGAPWLATLYGAYKICDEMIGRVYFEDWDIPSVGIRPGVVYGIGRDQGLTSKTTVAILAAAARKPYTVPFTGPVSALHAGEAASAFIRAVSEVRDDVFVFDLNGAATTVEEWLDIVRRLAPDARLDASGASLPFPADLSDAPIRNGIGDYGQVPLDEGIRATFENFRRLLERGVISPEAVV